MRVDELSDSERRLLRSGKAVPVKVKVANPPGFSLPRTRPGSNTGPGGWRCHRCGLAFTAYAPAERHARDERHHRIVTILTADMVIDGVAVGVIEDALTVTVPT